MHLCIASCELKCVVLIKMLTIYDTVCAEEKVRWIRSMQPLHHIDLLLDLETLQVVKLGLMRLECTVNVVFRSMRTCLTLFSKHTTFFIYCIINQNTSSVLQQHWLHYTFRRAFRQ